MGTVVVSREVDAAGLAELRRPLDRVLRERATGPDAWTVDEGPFRRWERRLEVGDTDPATGMTTVHQTVDYKLAIPLWAIIFVPIVRRFVKKPPPSGTQPFWLPPVLDARASNTLGMLSILSVYTGFLGVLLSQTNAFFQREFDVDNTAVSDAQIAVRVGAFGALAVAALADRWGRRRVLLWSITLAMVLAATGALTTNLWTMTLSQGVARVFSAATAMVLTVIAAEEVEPRARAFAISMLAMAAGLGAGGVVILLWLGDLGPGTWRIIFLVPLPFLATIPAIARRLHESRRYEVYDVHRTDAPRPAAEDRAVHLMGSARRRLVLVGAMLLFFNLFVSPQAAFVNNYLLNERGFSGVQITIFQVLTSLPAGIAIAVGGRLGDLYGRRRVGIVGIVGSTACLVLQYSTSGWPLWVASTVGTVLLGLTVPSLLVYPTEMFPTAQRSRAQGTLNLFSIVGTVVGLKAVGVLADRTGSYATGIQLVALGSVAVALIVLVWFPETTGRTLEELNPEDIPPPEGDELEELDDAWVERRQHAPPA